SVRPASAAGERHGLRPGAVFPAFGMAEVAIAGCFPTPMSGLSTDVINSVVLESEHLAVPVDLDHPNAREVVILGRPVPGLEFRIVDPETGEVCEDRRVGELQIAGTSVTAGYYERGEANEELFDGDWLRSGDLAYLVDGQMVMCGRIKDVIIIGGRNVHPQDIERVVGGIEGIRAGNVIAFSVPGRSGKERVVVVAETRAEDLERIRSEVSEQSVAAVGIPTSVVYLVQPGTLPKTSSGKLQRGRCRQQFLNDELAPAS
ncbi:MAG: AMP-binding protein, partial [Actinomycetia bacterium]|nr:AMP-binding protein [Actinomycetes bacterium]